MSNLTSEKKEKENLDPFYMPIDAHIINLRKLETV